jgi:predicted transcriptional regulator
MRPACEFSIRYLLPAFRASVARRLVDHYGLTQQEVATLLGTTQAAVSHYLADRRAKLVRSCEKSVMVKNFALQAAAKLASREMDSEGANEFFCSLCIKLQDEGSFWPLLGFGKRGNGFPQ